MNELSGFSSLSVVVPVYNGAENLPHLIERLALLEPRFAGGFEVLLVNDGSRDASWSVVTRLAAEHTWVRGFDLMRNYGQHAALLCGVRAARHAVVITMDDDLQHPPEEIPVLLGELAKGADVVYGTPRELRAGRWRNLASVLVRIGLGTVMGAATARNVSAFRALRTEVREGFAAYRSPAPSLDVLLSWSTTRFAAVPVRHEPRRSGASNYSFLGLVAHALDMMTGFSTLPLRLASLVGFAITLFGLGVLVWVVGLYFVLGQSVPGFPFLASIIAVFSGAQLFALGIIGEYLGRMHIRMLEQPPYVVRGGTEVASRDHPELAP